MEKFELPQEFRLRLMSKIMYLVVAAIFGGVLFYGIKNSVLLHNFQTSLISMSISLVGILIFVGLIRRKIVIDENSLSFTGMFSERTINIAEIIRI